MSTDGDPQRMGDSIQRGIDTAVEQMKALPPGTQFMLSGYSECRGDIREDLQALVFD